MEKSIEIKDTTNMTYEHSNKKEIEELNNIVKFIENDIINEENSPFTRCDVHYLDDSEDMIEWEVDIRNNGSITLDKRHAVHRQTMDRIVDYCVENNYYEILKKIFVVM